MNVNIQKVDFLCGDPLEMECYYIIEPEDYKNNKSTPIILVGEISPRVTDMGPAMAVSPELTATIEGAEFPLCLDCDSEGYALLANILTIALSSSYNSNDYQLLFHPTFKSFDKFSYIERRMNRFADGISHDTIIDLLSLGAMAVRHYNSGK